MRLMLGRLEHVLPFERTEQVIDVRFTELMTLRKCRRSWLNRYYYGLDTPPATNPGPKRSMHIGIDVDRALRAYYFEGTDPQAALRQWWESEVIPEIPADATEADHKAWDEVFDTSDRMLEGYVEWLADEGADAGEVHVGVELELSAVIPGTDVRLHTHLDSLVYDTTWNEWIIDDRKTVDTLTKSEQFQIDDQLLTYAWVVERALGIRVRRLRHTMLRRVKRTGNAKPPFYAREEITVSDLQVENHEKHLYSLATDLADAVYELGYGYDDHHHYVAPPAPSRDCTWWCPFMPICVAHDDGSDIDGLRDTLYIRTGHGHAPGYDTERNNDA